MYEYKTPVNRRQLQQNKVENLVFSDAPDGQIDEYLKFRNKKEKAFSFDAIPSRRRKYFASTNKCSGDNKYQLPGIFRYNINSHIALSDNLSVWFNKIFAGI